MYFWLTYTTITIYIFIVGNPLYKWNKPLPAVPLLENSVLLGWLKRPWLHFSRITTPIIHYFQ
uniref:Uncharacterized protein n=1 Tax=Anguilla anguilla TaxID=7936 RepID=A0A0E9QTW5_ANGAN